VAELTNNHKNLLRASIAGGVLLSALFSWLGYQDYQARNAALDQITQKRADIDKADAQIREIPKLEEKILILREAVNQYVRILPDDKEINSFVDQLTQFAARSDVRVKKLDDEDVRARTGRNQKGPTAAFDRVVYKLSIEGTCEQLLSFMDLFENHERFVKISSFKIDHRDPTQPDVDPMSVMHQIDIDLETYVYNAKVKSKENVVIPQEAQKLERLKAQGLVGEGTEPEFTLASYHHEPAPERRDLFYDPRIRLNDKTIHVDDARNEQRARLETFVGGIQKFTGEIAEETKIDNVVTRLQTTERINHGLAAFGAEIAKAKADRFFSLEDLRTRFEREVEEPFAKMSAGREGVGEIPLAQVEEMVSKMRASMSDRRWDEVVTIHDEVARTSPAVKADGVKALVKESDDMNRIASAHLDLDRRQMSFGGAVCFETDPAHAVVIINGRSYSPGESVDQDLVVRAITPASITFEFRGIVISHPMKISAPRPAAGPATPKSGAPKPGAPKPGSPAAPKKKKS
jgi:Tfp pilus assembly protein PilO